MSHIHQENQQQQSGHFSTAAELTGGSTMHSQSVATNPRAGQHPAALQLQKLQQVANSSAAVRQLRQYQQIANTSPQVQNQQALSQAINSEDSPTVQRQAISSSAPVAQMVRVQPPGDSHWKGVHAGGLPNAAFITLVKGIKDNIGDYKILDKGKNATYTDGTDAWKLKITDPGDESHLASRDALLKYLLDRKKEAYSMSGGRSFSGKSRAADPNDNNPNRENFGSVHPWKPIDTPSKIGSFNTTLSQPGGPDSQLKVAAAKGSLELRLTHSTRWDPGDRGSGQNSTMGGNSALSCVAANNGGMHPGGHWEWLHMIGSSLGGPNFVGNLVAGSFDANTEEIPFENKIRSWKDTTDAGNPTEIQAIASLDEDSWVATDLTLVAQHRGIQKRVHVNPGVQKKLRKDEYEAIEKEANKDESTSWDG